MVPYQNVSTSTVLLLLYYYSTVLYYSTSTVVVQFTYSTVSVLQYYYNSTLLQHSTSTVVVQYWYIITTVLALYQYCNNTVLLQYYVVLQYSTTTVYYVSRMPHALRNAVTDSCHFYLMTQKICMISDVINICGRVTSFDICVKLQCCLPAPSVDSTARRGSRFSGRGSTRGVRGHAPLEILKN